MPFIVAQPEKNHTGQKNTIVLFGGQGSRTLFSDTAVAAVKDIASGSAAAAILVSRCHAAFLEDYRFLTSREQQLIGLDLNAFLAPGKDHQSNGLVQSTTICLYQILLYIAEVERSMVEDDRLTDHILEATGLCSGMIPAAVIASSRSLLDVVNYGVEAFRVSFWTASRIVLEGQEQVGVLDHQDIWSVAVLGLSRSQVDEQMKQFCNQVSGPLYSHWKYRHNRFPDPAILPSDLGHHGSQNHINNWKALGSV